MPPPAEERFLLASYDAFESHPDVTGLLSPEERERLGGRMHQNILQQITIQKTPVRRRQYTGWKAAAAVLVLAGAATAAFLLLQPGSRKQDIAAAGQSVQPIQENNLISLPDGSTALVSAGSKLRYPASFAHQDKREVFLEGTALFTVEQQTGQPFVVHAGDYRPPYWAPPSKWRRQERGCEGDGVQRARTGGEPGEISGELTAHQQIVYTAGESRQQTTTEQPQWQQEDLLFDDVTLQQSARLLEDRFGYSISIPDEALRAQRFSTTLGGRESLEQALKSICAFNQAAYTIDSSQKTVIIYRP